MAYGKVAFGAPFLIPDAVDGRQIRMIDGRQQFRFPVAISFSVRAPDPPEASPGPLAPAAVGAQVPASRPCRPA